ncbi:hypothetical protein ABPG73_008309 [Tetrahymena malaccensis]
MTVSGINTKFEEIFSDKKYLGQMYCSNQISNARVGFYCLYCEGNQFLGSNQIAQCSDYFSKVNHEGDRYSQIIIDKIQISCKCEYIKFLKSQGIGDGGEADKQKPN